MCSSDLLTAHSLGRNQSIVYCTAFAMAEKFTKICDLRPYMKGVNCVFMVLEKGMCVLSVWRCLRASEMDAHGLVGACL